MKFSFESEDKFYEFVKKNISSDPKSLYLHVSGREYPFPARFAVEQIECRQKTSRKLSLFTRNARFIFPSVLSAEQATHQCVASYHASLLPPGSSVIDITAGLGIDSMMMTMKGHKTTAIEIDPARASALEHNREVLGLGLLETVCADSIEWIKCNARGRGHDVLFVDPARRDHVRGRVYQLCDCRPDVSVHESLLLDISPKVLVKASPLLDVSEAVRQMDHVSEVHIVSVQGECKEVLMTLERKDTASRRVVVVDLEEKSDASVSVLKRFEVEFSEISSRAPVASASEITAGSYLYDPVSGLHKLRCGHNICLKFGNMKQLAPNTDLFVSSVLHPDFPGRIFRVKARPDKKMLKGLRHAGMEVISRNYPLTPEQIRRKTGLTVGGGDFLIAARTTNAETPTLLLCERI